MASTRQGPGGLPIARLIMITAMVTLFSQLAEVKDFEDLNNSGWSTWYFRLGGGRGWNARCKMDFASWSME